MIPNIPFATNTGPPKTHSHNDNDTLVVSLPPVTDLSVYTVLKPVFTFLRHPHKHEAQGRINKILLNFTYVRDLHSCSVAAFIRLNGYIKDHGIKLIMLNAPKEIRVQLTWRLPNAIWLNSSPGLVGRRDEKGFISTERFHA